MQNANWSQRTIDFLTPRLQDLRHQLRIATGYFTIHGYHHVAPYLVDKQVHILVGYDEAAKEYLRTSLSEAVLRDLSQWDAVNRRQAVADVVTKLQRGQLQIIDQQPNSEFAARLRPKDHAKLFIFDEDEVIVGSANLTHSGLIGNTEGVSATRDPGAIAYWSTTFANYWTAPDTEDISAQLLAALLRWLELANPFDVYLRTLLVLVTTEEIEAPRDDYKMPVHFQQVVIERLLRQLHNHAGAMLVASTGLGKTIMATHTALRLSHQGHISDVIVFAPAVVKREWEQAFESARLRAPAFTRDLLDQPQRSTKTRSQLDMIESALEHADAKTLIIIDETQHFRHQRRQRDANQRRSFQRLRRAVIQGQARVLLLTATPYSTGVTDINNQLFLLPHTAPPDFRTAYGQFIIPGIRDDDVHPEAWRLDDTDDFFEQFLDLPVSTVISTAQVARDFAISTSEGDYIQFPDRKGWIPQVVMHRITTPVPEGQAMQQALAQGMFQHTRIRYRKRDGSGGWSKVNVQREAETALTSSPLALQEVLARAIAGDYRVDFDRSEERRRAVLEPILTRLQQMTPDKDQKFVQLTRIVETHTAQEQRVLIFTSRHATAVYLADALAQAFPHLQIATTSVREAKRPDAPAHYRLRPFGPEVLDLVYRFAPEANRDYIQPEHRDNPIHVLIVTDAFSAGINLQDAAVVVHYDLAWTPDTLIQRAGRILRFWHRPRSVHFYVFVSRFAPDEIGYELSTSINRRLELLTTRSEQARKFSGLPVIPQDDTQHIDRLGDLSAVTYEDLGQAFIGALGDFDAISPLLRHNAVLKEHTPHAHTIPDDITSALAYAGHDPLLYLLLRHQGHYHWCLYDIQRERLQDITEDRLLNLLACAPDESVAAVNADIIEECAQQARSLWLAHNPELEPDQVQRICALYLHPAASDQAQSIVPSRAK